MPAVSCPPTHQVLVLDERACQSTEYYVHYICAVPTHMCTYGPACVALATQDCYRGYVPLHVAQAYKANSCYALQAVLHSVYAQGLVVTLG